MRVEARYRHNMSSGADVCSHDGRVSIDYGSPTLPPWSYLPPTHVTQFDKNKNKTSITGYLGISVHLLLIFGHKIFTKSRRIKPAKADFYTGKMWFYQEEEDFLARKAVSRV